MRLRTPECTLKLIESGMNQRVFHSSEQLLMLYKRDYTAMQAFISFL